MLCHFDCKTLIESQKGLIEMKLRMFLGIFNKVLFSNNILTLVIVKDKTDNKANTNGVRHVHQNHELD